MWKMTNNDLNKKETEKLGISDDPLSLEVLAEQICKYRLFDEEEIRSILRDIGLEFKEITSCRQYHVYHKVCELS